MSSQTAQQLYEQYPDSRGKLALVLDQQMVTSTAVLLPILRMIGAAWWQQRRLILVLGCLLGALKYSIAHF